MHSQNKNFNFLLLSEPLRWLHTKQRQTTPNNPTYEHIVPQVNYDHILTNIVEKFTLNYGF